MEDENAGRPVASASGSGRLRGLFQNIRFQPPAAWSVYASWLGFSQTFRSSDFYVDLLPSARRRNAGVPSRPKRGAVERSPVTHRAVRAVRSLPPGRPRPSDAWPVCAVHVQLLNGRRCQRRVRTARRSALRGLASSTSSTAGAGSRPLRARGRGRGFECHLVHAPCSARPVRSRPRGSFSTRYTFAVRVLTFSAAD